MTATDAAYTTTSSYRRRERVRDRQLDLPPSSERQVIYQSRVYRLACSACDLDGEVRGAAAVGRRLREHSRVCRGDAYGEPTGRVGTL